MTFLNLTQNRVAWFAGLLLLLNTFVAQAVTPPCGTTLITDTTLDSDLDCSAFDGAAIRLTGAGSDNVTLDCANHIISAGSKSAIIVSNVSGVTIQNCTILTSVDFSHGVLLHNGASNSQVSDNDIETTADFSHGIEVRQSFANQISDNIVLTTGQGSNSLRMRSGSSNNLVSGNTLKATEASPVNIQSSSDNEVIDNTLDSPWDFLVQHNLSLQGGGMGIDSAGNIYAVENALGSSGDGIGTVTAFSQIDPTTGASISVIPLLMGGNDIGFGFHALDILPDGRILALSDSDSATALYEIDPNSGEVTEILLTLPALGGIPNGLEATSDTTLLATTNSGELLKIELTSATTGDVTVIGQSGTGWTDLAIHPTTGRAYTVSHSGAEATGTNHLYEIDADTGQIIGAQIGIGDLRRRFITDIDFAFDGTLYGNNGDQLIAINLADGSNIHIGGFGPNELEPFVANTHMENNLLRATTSGSIQFTTRITLPTQLQTSISRKSIKINFNDAMVDTAELPFLDAPARITLTGLNEGSDRTLLVDENDDGTFSTCAPSRCTLIDFSGGTLVFDVTGFTTYSSENNSGVSQEESDGSGNGSGGLVVGPSWLLLIFLVLVLKQGLRFKSRYH